jgi:hypothetical protein
MIARIGTRAFLVTLLVALAACNKAPLNGPASAAASQSSAAGQSSKAATSATAEEVAEEGRGKIPCPAKIKTPARASDAPVDDVVGVRPGMTFDEAANVVMCTHDLMVATADTGRRFNIQTYGQTIRQGFSARFAEPRVQKTSKQIMQEMQDETVARSGNAVRRDMKPGQSKWYVSTMGIPGKERVIAAAREEWFEEGRNPTMDSVVQALSKKYGAPTHNQDYGNSRVLTWAYDPLGRRLTETSPLYHQCRGSADPDGATNFSPDCGVVVAAMSVAMRENPGLTQYLQVGVIDQADGYEAITGTERALQELDAQRKAKELEAAGKSADAPQL